MLLAFFASTAQTPKELILPTPTSVTAGEGEFSLNAKTRIVVADEAQTKAAKILAAKMRVAALYDLQLVAKSPKNNAVVYRHCDTIPSEGYVLTVDKSLVTIRASDAAGYFYATQSLLQLLPEDVFATSAKPQRWSVPAVTIYDSPKYAYRGFMLDAARYFVPKDKVLRMLDYMALHKLNRLHWHLVDDNGWRLEIKKYPLLTSIGGFRTERQQMFPMRTNPTPGEPTTTGGFYTQDDVREVVTYAKALNIEVIPEIEMPAHTNSSLAAYPNLACPIVDYYLGTTPGSGGKHASAIYCAGREQTFEFLQSVMDEVMELFPSKYIHIGGDEAWKDNWEKCPLCQKRMADNGIENEAELQSYFIQRINAYIQSHGRSIMGWDELVDSRLPEGAVIFGWRGMGASAVKAAAAGHQVVLTPAMAFYLIRYQGPQWFEPYTYFGNNTLADVYDYHPSKSGITKELEPMVMGVQGSLWSEFIYSWENLQYMAFPRLAAVAECGWSSHAKDWPDFLKRLDHMTAIYDRVGVNYARSMFNLFHKVEGRGGKLYATVWCLRPDVDIRYTVDGSVPTSAAPIYKGEVELTDGVLFQAATFVGTTRAGAVLPLRPIRNLATGHAVRSESANVAVVTNGILGSERYTDGEFLDVYDSDVEFTIDLGCERKVSSISISMLINAGMRTHLPRRISVLASRDAESGNELTQREYSDSEIFPNTFSRTMIELADFEPTTTRYLTFKLQNPGDCPSWHPAAGGQTRIAVDEVIVK